MQRSVREAHGCWADSAMRDRLLGLSRDAQQRRWGTAPRQRPVNLGVWRRENGGSKDLEVERHRPLRVLPPFAPRRSMSPPLLCPLALLPFVAVSPSPVQSVSATAAVDLEEHYSFPDFGFMIPPAEYQGPVFRLSKDYPTELAPLEPEVQEILAMDYQNDSVAYALAVRDYVFRGNIDPNDDERCFTFENGESTRWFHVPWQHWGSSGREGFHGLTKEGPLAARSLSPSQSLPSNAYAVGFYNQPGGYTIGQTWANPMDPDLSYVNGEGFPTGTIVAKFLFTTLPASQVPQLVDPVSWNAYVYLNDVPYASAPDPSARVATTVHLLQMDIMVKDPRATESNGWVFGTFAYNGELGKENRWENLQPVGVMWGNDPDVKLSNNNAAPVATCINPDIKQSRINPDPSLPAQHLGWNGRLNGPADNPNSSCMSCHMTAEYPAVSSILPFLNSPPVSIPRVGTEAGAPWMRWFQNTGTNDPFDPGKAMTTDFSLQLAKSVQNFIEYRAQTQAGLFSAQYWSNGGPVHRISRGAPQ